MDDQKNIKPDFSKAGEDSILYKKEEPKTEREKLKELHGKKVINDFLEGKVFGNAHFFVNSVEFIATMIKNCNLTNENTRIIFSKNNESYKHTCQGISNSTCYLSYLCTNIH